jgi:hypothetical protein
MWMARWSSKWAGVEVVVLWLASQMRSLLLLLHVAVVEQPSSSQTSHFAVRSNFRSWLGPNFRKTIAEIYKRKKESPPLPNFTFRADSNLHQLNCNVPSSMQAVHSHQNQSSLPKQPPHLPRAHHIQPHCLSKATTTLECGLRECFVVCEVSRGSV